MCQVPEAKSEACQNSGSLVLPQLLQSRRGLGALVPLVVLCWSKVSSHFSGFVPMHHKCVFPLMKMRPLDTAGVV